MSKYVKLSAKFHHIGRHLCNDRLYSIHAIFLLVRSAMVIAPMDWEWYKVLYSLIELHTILSIIIFEFLFHEDAAKVLKQVSKEKILFVICKFIPFI